MKVIKDLIPYLAIILVVALVRIYIVTPIMVQGESMVPTLSGGEVMILKKYDTNYKRFDIVVVNSDVEGNNLIKRVIGLPGETIKYKDDTLYINDEIIDDPYANGSTGIIKEITLEDNEYFLMGDNRSVSLDSRILGPIKKDYIEGTTELILYPFNKIGIVK